MAQFGRLIGRPGIDDKSLIPTRDTENSRQLPKGVKERGGLQGIRKGK